MTDTYDYELIYHHRDLVSTTKFSGETFEHRMKFSAMIELQDLKDHLRTFLISAGWSADQLTFLEDPEERECEMQRTVDRLEQELQRYKDTIQELQEDKDDQ